jgi:4-diphosphocytidyl-2-C-methyl-D-erythritol kinase
MSRGVGDQSAAGASEVIRVRAHAKVNLALKVGAPGEDGYHPLATVFQTISLADRLSAHPLGRHDPEAGLHPDVPIELIVEGVSLPEHNTVTRAAGLLAGLLEARGGATLQPLSLRLKKRIPIGAGLGGGSSDAVAALIACSRLWCGDGSRPPAEEMTEIARRVGADVPFFLTGGTALGTSRGDYISPLEEIPQQWLVVAAPCSVSVATPAAYAAFDTAMGWSSTGGARGTSASPEIRGYSGELDQSWMGNDLHAPVIGLYPEVEAAREALRRAGARIAQMSGSGSASFGTFADRRKARLAARDLRDQGYRSWACVTVSARQHAAALNLES